MLSETFATLLRSTLVAERVVKDLKVEGMTADQLVGGLSVRAVPGTMLLRVSLDHPDPGLAVRILDAQTTRVVSLNRELRSADSRMRENTSVSR